jgi:hypothetical protein
MLMRALIPVLLLCTACTQVAQQGVMLNVEENTWVAVEESANGFLITVEYVNAEKATVAATCKRALLSQASAYAGKRGKNIQPINEQRITMSVGWIGMTRGCSAQVPVEWQ